MKRVHSNTLILKTSKCSILNNPVISQEQYPGKNGVKNMLIVVTRINCLFTLTDYTISFTLRLTQNVPHCNKKGFSFFFLKVHLKYLRELRLQTNYIRTHLI